MFFLSEADSVFSLKSMISIMFLLTFCRITHYGKDTVDVFQTLLQYFYVSFIQREFISKKLFEMLEFL